MRNGKLLPIIITALSVTFFLSSCEKDENPSDKLIERKDFVLTRSEMDFVQENNGFALELFKRVSDMEKGKSTVISPLSVTMDFGMVSNGAAGKTRDEISNVLGYKDGSVEGLNSFCQSMLEQSRKVDPSTTVEIGMGKSLSKFVKKASKEAETLAGFDCESFESVKGLLL